MRIGFFAAAIAALSLTTAAAAQTNVQHYFTYYSDSTKTEVVGYTIIYCDGTATGNGYPTPYYDQESWDC